MISYFHDNEDAVIYIRYIYRLFLRSPGEIAGRKAGFPTLRHSRVHNFLDETAVSFRLGKGCFGANINILELRVI